MKGKHGTQLPQRRRSVPKAAVAELSERLQGAGVRVARSSSTGECTLGS